MQTMNVRTNKDSWQRKAEMWGGGEMKAYQVNRQEGGLLPDIKGGVESRPQPSGQSAGEVPSYKEGEL